MSKQMSSLDEHHIKDLLDRCCSVVESAEPGTVFYCWTSTAYNTEHYFIRGDKLMLNTVSMGKDGDVVYRQCAPCIYRDRTNHRFRYSHAPQHKITSGERKGFVVTFEDLEPNESFCQAGIHRLLETGPDTWNIQPRRAKDRQILDILDYLEEAYDEDALRSIPELYLTIPSKSRRLPFLRDSRSSMQWLREFPGFDEDGDLVRNLFNLRGDITKNAGSGREGWPYRHFQGSGVVAASASNLATWYKTTAADIDLPHITISFAD